MITRIDIEPASFHGAYWVTVNDDPEHPLSQGCANLETAMIVMAEINADIAEQWANAPARRSAILKEGDRR